MLFEKFSPKLVKVTRDGAFVGWLERDTRKTSGLHAERIAFWSGTVEGREISAPTLNAAKAKLGMNMPTRAQYAAALGPCCK